MPESNSLQAHATLSDHASLEDLLGYGPYVVSLEELLTHPSVTTPFAVGVFGPWGTGKSSFMLQLHERLEQKGLPAVWFQPWLFDEKEEVWKALILSILQYLEGKTQDKTQLASIKSLVAGVGKIALNQVISKATGLNLTVEQIAQAYSNTSSDNTRFINTFRRDFSQVKDAILSNNDEQHSRLYVFVDDLDRCTPENCVSVLEAIRLFFDLEGCLFILGIDQEVVQKGIEIKYDQHLKMLGRDYLDKLIQLPFTLPPISEKSFDSFVRATTAPFSFQDQSRELIALASKKNPRRVKRLSNCLQLLRTAARSMANDGTGPETLADTDAERHLAFLLVLQVRFPIAYRWLVQNLESIGGLHLSSQSKAELINSMEGSYGQATAKSLADEIISFVGRAQQDGLIPSDWKGKEAFVRVTALVEVDTSSKEVERPSKLIIDNQYAQIESTQPESESDIGQPSMPDGSKEQTERINRLVEDVKGSLASLDDVFEPSFRSVLLGFTDRLFHRAEDVLDILIDTVEALKQLDPIAVPIRANAIADDRGRRQLIGLARYVVSIGWSIAGVGMLLAMPGALFGTSLLSGSIFYEFVSLDPLVASSLLLLGLALCGRGVVLVRTARHQLRVASMRSINVASSSRV